MSRQIKINKYQGNTVYSVHVVDSYGTEHHLGYYSELGQTPEYDSAQQEIEERAEEIWANEIKPEEDLHSNAVQWCIDNSPRFTDSRGNHRDGLD